jgi:hypothetical protein
MASRHSTAPAGQTNGRTTEQVALRLRPDVALRLRASAEAAGRTMSDYVAALVDGRANGAGVHPVCGVADEPAASRMHALGEVSRLANAIYNHKNALHLARGELGRAHGGVKHLFETATTAAEAHRFELAAAVRSLRDAIAKADQTIAEVDDAYGPIRSELCACAKRLTRIG